MNSAKSLQYIWCNGNRSLLLGSLSSVFAMPLSTHTAKQSSVGPTLKFDTNTVLHYFDGYRQLPKAPTHKFKVKNPSSGETLTECPASSVADVAHVISSAKAAQPAWGSMCGLERGKILSKAGEIIRVSQEIKNNLDDIAKLEVLDNGKPIYEARWDIEGCADTFTYYGGIAATIKGDHIPLAGSTFAYTRREPLGVVVGIGAWNYPFQTMSWKCAPALACGNSFVYKPSPFTPVTAVVLAEILTQAGLPKGVISIVQGEQETGEALCQHPEVAKVSFTGSVLTGQRIMQMCAINGLRHVTLELGGKSPLIIFDDANMDNAISGAMLANFLTQGEVCSNAARVLVHRNRVEEFTHRVVARTKAMLIGDPMHENTRVGATISEQHMNKVLSYIQSAKDEGARVLYGGERIYLPEPHLKAGYFLSPCVIDNVTDSMRVAREEIFGSVLCILPFDTDQEVVARANATPFGLGAGLFTQNLQRAHNVAAQLQAGTVWINSYNTVSPEIPFGGFKMSGFGREQGEAALHHYSQIKSVFVETGNIDCPI